MISAHCCNSLPVQDKKSASRRTQAKRMRNEIQEHPHDCGKSVLRHRMGRVKIPSSFQTKMNMIPLSELNVFVVMCQSIRFSPGNQHKTVRSGRYGGITHNACKHIIV